MSMTQEEATEYFESLLKRFEEMHETETSYWGKVHAETTIEATRLALSALRGPTREMVERMRGEWIEDEFAISHCSLCGYEQEEPELITPFCPLCGSPMTDEAVDMMMERWKEALHEIPSAT